MYTRAFLIELRSLLPNNNNNNLLRNMVWKSLISNGISRIKPTRRGCSAGRRKKHLSGVCSNSIPSEVLPTLKLSKNSAIKSRSDLHDSLNIQVNTFASNNSNTSPLPSNSIIRYKISGTLLNSSVSSLIVLNSSRNEAELAVKESELTVRSNDIQPIATAHIHKQQQRRGVDFGNLIRIPLLQLKTTITSRSTHCLVLVLINSRSLNKNGFKLKDHVVDHDCDIAAVTETWLPDNDVIANQIIGDTCPQGYRMLHTPRKLGQRGGGVGLMFKTSLGLRTVTKDVVASNFSAFEYCEYLLKSTIWVRLVVVYRPPPSAANGLTTAQFFRDFSTFLECLVP